MDSVGEREGGEIWENGIETCIISCMKRVASPGSMHSSGCLGLVHWDRPRGRVGEGGGWRARWALKSDEAEKGQSRGEKGSSSTAKIRKEQEFLKCLENGNRV